MATNYIYRFCQDGDASDVLSDSDYQSDSDRTIGHQPGIARAELANKVGRDASAVAAMIGEFTANRQSQDFSSDSNTSDLVSFFVAALGSVIDDTLDSVYPVGSVYINASSDSNPQSFLPGSWTRIDEGFLYPSGADGAGSLGRTGGEESVTLSLSQMPQHRHLNGIADDRSSGDSNSFWVYSSTKTDMPGNAKAAVTAEPSNTPTYQGTTSYSGNGAAHNNMPPYITVSMWRRTS